MENEAIWPMKSESCIGFIGSWCCSWATNSFRNWSLPMAEFWPLADCVAAVGVEFSVGMEGISRGA